jgi:hypothetical protein
MAIVSGREKPLANEGRAGHLRGANSAADLFDKLKAGSHAPVAMHEKNAQRPTLNVQRPIQEIREEHRFCGE